MTSVDPFKDFPIPLMPIDDWRIFKAARADLNKRFLKQVDMQDPDLELMRKIILQWAKDWFEI